MINRILPTPLYSYKCGQNVRGHSVTPHGARSGSTKCITPSKHRRKNRRQKCGMHHRITTACRMEASWELERKSLSLSKNMQSMESHVYDLSLKSSLTFYTTTKKGWWYFREYLWLLPLLKITPSSVLWWHAYFRRFNIKLPPAGKQVFVETSSRMPL